MTRVAILIDGGFFLKRLPTVCRDVNCRNPEEVARAIDRLLNAHLVQLNELACLPRHYALLYRCFYYDALPYLEKGHLPISGSPINFARTEEAHFRLALFDRLRRKPNFAVRLGHVVLERSWILTERTQRALLRRQRTVDSLTDADFVPGFRQKAVDMRIGIDIAALALKGQVDTIVLVAGDADFVPAAKLARREGVRIILDPLWQSVSADLFEHIDGLRSGFPNPRRRREEPAHVSG